MTRRGLSIAVAIACGGCDSGVASNTKQLDPCVLVTQNDAAAFFGPAVKQPSGGSECLWGFDSSDFGSWSLRVTVWDHTKQAKPLIIVTKNETTYMGEPVTPPTIFEHLPIGGDNNGSLYATDAGEVSLVWRHGENLTIHLELRWDESPRFKATTKIEPMKRLALKVEAALENR